MTQPVDNKEEGWQEWLRKYDLWEGQLDVNKLYLRYRKFSSIKFDSVPQEWWERFYKDLLYFEDGLVFGNSIGRVDEYPFQFTVEDDTPIRDKPIQYAKTEREWIKGYMQDQVDLGVVRRVGPGDPEPCFTVGAVLVKDGQSQQKYRLCCNLPSVNGRIVFSVHPLNECHSSLDQLQGLKYKSAIDCKAGFLNCLIPKELQRFTGMVTQDALFVFLRMTFGYHSAPAFFQSVMNAGLDKSRFPIAHGVYLDDCPVGGQTMDEAWAATLEAMRCLLCLGLPINIWKCQFLQEELTVLGWALKGDDYRLGKKAMSKLFATELPKDLQALQSLVGKFNFASLFLGDFKSMIAPLIQLMGSRSDHTWTKQHTWALNRLGAAVWEGLTLSIFDPQVKLTVHIDAGDEFGEVALVQKLGGSHKLIALAGKRLLKTEASCSQMEKLLVVALWALKRYQKYCAFAVSLEIALPHPAEVVVCGSNDPPLRIKAKLIELSSFGASFVWGEGALCVGGELGKLLSSPPDHGDEGLRCPQWQHEDFTLEMPGKPKSGEWVLGDLIMHFDGASGKHQIGAGGFIIQDKQGEYLVAGGNFYGPKVTNNVAEAKAMLDGTRALTSQIHEGIKTVVFKGDSDLVISFMSRRYKPKKRELSIIVKQTWEIIKGWKTVRARFLHVPREFNQAADWLSKVCRQLEVPLDLSKYSSVVGSNGWPVQPPFRLAGRGIEGGVLGVDNKSSDSDVVGAIWTDATSADVVCDFCKDPIQGRILACGSCSKSFHTSCIDIRLFPQRLGPWHCKSCLKWFASHGIRDVLLDEPLLKYLSHREVPSSLPEAARVTKAASYISMNERGQVFVSGINEGPWRYVPPFSNRRHLLMSCLRELAFPSGARLYAALQSQYWWVGMMSDCIEIAFACFPRQQEKAKFKSPRFLFPTPKPNAPFRLWAVDCLTGLKPPAPDGSTDVIIAVDPFTKWVEVGPLPNLDSYHSAEWFHREITCRYGLPAAVRSDQGREFLGRFHAYLAQYGIAHLPIIARNPRANGQAERFVREVKKGLRMLTTSCPGGHWWEFLPDIARGLRVIPSRATGHAPYVLVFKQQPVLAFPQSLRVLSEEDWELTGGEHIEQLQAAWQDIFKEVQLRLKRSDDAMVEAYSRRQDLADIDVRFVFTGGDLVFLKQRQPGKLKIKSTGPYIFLQYLGRLRVQAKIMNYNNQVFQVSAGNLLPVDPPATRMVRFAPDTTPSLASPQFPSTASPFASSSSQPSTPHLPPGTILEPEWHQLQPTNSPRSRRKLRKGG